MDWPGTVMTERAQVQEYNTSAFGKIDVVHRLNPLCAHDNAARPASRYSHDIWKVKNCARRGFVYIEKAPTYETLFSDMAWERTTKIEERRRDQIRPVSYKFSKSTRKRLHFLPRKKMHQLVRAYAKPGNVIDLGCGSGGHMTELDDCFVPFGVEISTQLAGMADELFRQHGGQAVNAPSIKGLREFPDGFCSAASLRS